LSLEEPQSWQRGASVGGGDGRVTVVLEDDDGEFISSLETVMRGLIYSTLFNRICREK